MQDGLRRRDFKVRNLNVSGTVTGNVVSAPVSGTGKVYYVDANVATGRSGDGSTWESAFKTITAAIAVLSDYDTLYIAPAYYNETATLALANLIGVKIFGSGTGMGWGEGTTMIGDESHTTHGTVLTLSGCRGVEIAGLMFYNSEDEKSAIVFTGLSYSINIHHCSFVGDVGGGSVTEVAINGNGEKAPDLYVHDCWFFRQEAQCIVAGHQRNVIENNYFIVDAAAMGIKLEGTTTSSFNVIKNNYFLGAASTGSGISYAAGLIGNFMIADNLFVNFSAGLNIANVAEGGGTADENCVDNFQDDANGGATAADPETAS